jgi:hypothetical protein
MAKKYVALTVVAVAVSALSWKVQSQGQTPATGTLTALDYIEIQQLVNRYAFAIDTCSNNGYDYADLYVPDGVFMNSSSSTRWQGRERLAEAAGGAGRGCKKLTDPANAGRSHTTINLIIEPSPEGAIGKSYLVYPGVEGVHSDPGHTGHVGGYQDVYVKTPQGWRFKSRVHVIKPYVPGTYKIPDAGAPSPAPAAPRR